jgi:hypothetical protein
MGNPLSGKYYSAHYDINGDTIVVTYDVDFCYTEKWVQKDDRIMTFYNDEVMIFNNEKVIYWKLMDDESADKFRWYIDQSNEINRVCVNKSMDHINVDNSADFLLYHIIKSADQNPYRIKVMDLQVRSPGMIKDKKSIFYLCTYQIGFDNYSWTILNESCQIKNKYIIDK